MSSLREYLSTLSDQTVIETLADLHEKASRQNVNLATRFGRYLPRLITGRQLPWAHIEPKLEHMYLAIEPENGLFIYLLARAMQASRIVEFGTSHGISTIYLALALRDNGGGLVTGTELIPAKATQARTNIKRAGLTELVDIREGDALETLSTIDGPIDLLLNDGFPRFTLPILKLLAPRMRKGAVVICGNASAFPADHADYLDWVRNPANGFQSMKLPLRIAGEFSIKAYD